MKCLQLHYNKVLQKMFEFRCNDGCWNLCRVLYGNDWTVISHRKVRNSCKLSKVMGHDARSEMPSGVCNLFTWEKLDTLHTLQGSDEVDVRVYLHVFFNVDINLR